MNRCIEGRGGRKSLDGTGGGDEGTKIAVCGLFSGGPGNAE